ncbi:MAG: PBP1A family penicillin-binding protein [Candidatus Moraniibacteriota bacterium]
MRRFFRFSLKLSLFIFILGVLATVGIFAYIAKDLPSPGKVNKRFIAESTKIYDRTGEHLLYEVHGEEKRTLIPFSEMPESLRAATLTLEDQDFYSHHGIKLTSIVRAIVKDVLHQGAAQGGSTITQQFVKNSLLTNEKTLIRKVKEVILSIEVEQKFSKDEILEMYLNEIPYGSNAYGIEAATQTYFGKHAKELSLDEAAILASLPKAPSTYSPYGSRTEQLKIRQEVAIKNMARLGYITEDQAKEAIAVDVLKKILPQKNIIAAPHFVMFVKEYLDQKYGELSIEQSGLRVYTTLDWDKQMAAEQAVREGAEKNMKWKASNAALVAMDPKTGQILAMVGSKDYFDSAIDGQVNVTIRERQPGSSMKPYIYLTAFEKGYSPDTLLYDTPTQFDTNEEKKYEPQNYDGKFRGPISMKEALPQSLNIPAVKTLYLVGVNDAVKTAKNLGITTLNYPDRYGLSLVLGGGEVKLIDHVHAYASLAAGGVKRQQSALLRVEDAHGNILEEYKSDPGERVIEEKYVAILDHVMSTNAYRAPVFGENNPLRFDNRQVAAKTGTTNEFRDAWTVGFAPSIAVGVWVGNNNNDPMTPGADGSIVAAPIWRAFMDKALVNTPIENFPEYKPEDTENKDAVDKPLMNGKVDSKENVKVCKIKSDKYCLANDYCRDKDIEKKTFVSSHDILSYVNRDDPTGAIPDKPDRDSQYKGWEKGVKDWYSDQKKIILGDPPKDSCTQDDFSQYKPSVTISTSGDASSSSITLSVSSDAPYGVRSVSYEVDGKDAGSSTSKPYSVSYDIPADKNNSTISVEAKLEDSNGNTTTASKNISVHY